MVHRAVFYNTCFPLPRRQHNKTPPPLHTAFLRLNNKYHVGTSLLLFSGSFPLITHTHTRKHTHTHTYRFTRLTRFCFLLRWQLKETSSSPSSSSSRGLAFVVWWNFRIFFSFSRGGQHRPFVTSDGIIRRHWQLALGPPPHTQEGQDITASPPTNTHTHTRTSFPPYSDDLMMVGGLVGWLCTQMVILVASLTHTYYPSVLLFFSAFFRFFCSTQAHDNTTTTAQAQTNQKHNIRTEPPAHTLTRTQTYTRFPFSSIFFFLLLPTRLCRPPSGKASAFFPPHTLSYTIIFLVLFSPGKG